MELKLYAKYETHNYAISDIQKQPNRYEADFTSMRDLDYQVFVWLEPYEIYWYHGVGI